MSERPAGARTTGTSEECSSEVATVPMRNWRMSVVALAPMTIATAPSSEATSMRPFDSFDAVWMTPRAAMSSGMRARASSSHSSSCWATMPVPSLGIDPAAWKVEDSGRMIVTTSSISTDRAMEIAREMASRPRSVAMYPTTRRGTDAADSVMDFSRFVATLQVILRGQEATLPGCPGGDDDAPRPDAADTVARRAHREDASTPARRRGHRDDGSRSESLCG